MAGPNTRDERAASIGLFLGFGRVLPNADAGAEAAADRQQLALSYPGILAQAVSIPATLNDLTTVWMQDYQPPVYAALAVGSRRDLTTLIKADQGNALGYDGEQDLNTAYAKYINTEF